MNNLNSANKEFKNILKKRNMLSDTMGEDISESWMRCISTGLDPFKDPKQSLVSSVELKQIIINGKSTKIVAVLNAGFKSLRRDSSTDLLLPYHQLAELLPNEQELTPDTFTYVLGNITDLEKNIEQYNTIKNSKRDDWQRTIVSNENIMSKHSTLKEVEGYDDTSNWTKIFTEKFYASLTEISQKVSEAEEISNKARTIMSSERWIRRSSSVKRSTKAERLKQLVR